MKPENNAITDLQTFCLQQSYKICLKLKLNWFNESEPKRNEIKLGNTFNKCSSSEVFKSSSCFNSSYLEYKTQSNICTSNSLKMFITNYSRSIFFRQGNIDSLPNESEVIEKIIKDAFLRSNFTLITIRYIVIETKIGEALSLM